MRKTSYSSEVHASLETIWKMMVEKVEQPEQYHPGVVQSRVLQHHGDGVLREILTDAGLLLKEKVVLDPAHGEVQFLMIDHPLLSGRVLHRVVPTSIQNPAAPQLLTIEVQWSTKDVNAEQLLESQLAVQTKQEVLALKERAESVDSGSPIRQSYAFGKSVALPFVETVAKVREALAHEGFGILCDIDVRQKFQEKLQKDFRNYTILGACNPALAYQALGAELNIGTLLPCNVVVYSADEATTVVMAMDPVAALSMVGNSQLTGLAATVKEKLERALAAL